MDPSQSSERPGFSRESWTRVREVLERALELPEGEREGFVLAETTGEPALRDRALKLLGHDSAGDRLPDPPDPQNHDVDPWLGRRVGAYELRERIGVGGMGAVYLAERVDGAFDKRVAVKLIARGLWSERALERFHRERQLLAGLEHPGIARLLDGGSADGQPFLVMEYVEGSPIDEFCDRRKLPLRARLELFRSVCEAVRHAHRNLVVHRDLKPANILVTAAGEAKLLDFGIAKVLEPDDGERSDELTADWARAMTPAYASPEQVRAEHVGTATDVYALGVLFYRLLSERQPYEIDSSSWAAIERVVCETTPPAPSTVAADRRWLEGDLDAITLMALRKEPDRRYASVEQFSEDVRRHLVGLPVVARPDTVGYRAARFLQRNRLVVAAVAVVLLSLAAGLFVALAAWREEARQREIALERAADIRTFATKTVSDLAAEVQKTGSVEALERIVQLGLTHLEKVDVNVREDPESARQVALTFTRLANLQGGTGQETLGRTRAALATHGKAVAVLRELTESDPADLRNVYHLVQALRVEGDLLRGGGQTAAAGDAYRRALDACRAFDRPTELDPRWVHAWGTVLTRVGHALADLGEYAEAHAHFAQTQDLYGTALVQSGTGALRYHLALSYRDTALLATLEKDHERAIEMQELAIATLDQFIAATESRWTNEQTRATLYRGLAAILDGAEEPELALAAYLDASEILGTVLARAPNNVGAAYDRASTLNWIGMIHLKLDAPDDAQAAASESLSISERAIRLAPEMAKLRVNRAWSRCALGDVAKHRGALAQGQSRYVQARDEFDALHRSDPDDVLAGRKLGMTYVRLARVEVELARAATDGRERARWRQSARDRVRAGLDLYDAMERRGVVAPDLDARREELRAIVADL